MQYNKKGNKVQGSMLMIRHTMSGEIYRVKSNALYGLALSPTDSPFGFVSFAGKSTYMEPGWYDAVGNHEFILYAEDHGEQRCNQVDPDKVWITVLPKDGEVYADGMPLTLGPDAVGDATPINCGNIFVPHTPN